MDDEILGSNYFDCTNIDYDSRRVGSIVPNILDFIAKVSSLGR